MVTNDVEDHTQSEGVRAIDECTEFVGRAVKMRWSEDRGSVVSPSEVTGKFRDRHDFKESDSGFCQFRQALTRRVPCALRCEGPDMHFIDDLPLDGYPFPRRIVPRVRCSVHDL